MEKLFELYTDINNILAKTGCSINSPLHQEVIRKSLSAKWDLTSIEKMEKKPNPISVYQKKFSEAFEAGDTKEATKASVAISFLLMLNAGAGFKQSKKSALDILDCHMQTEAFKKAFVSLGEALAFKSTLEEEFRNFELLSPCLSSMGIQDSYRDLGPIGPVGVYPTNIPTNPWGMTGNGAILWQFNPDHPMQRPHHNFWDTNQAPSSFAQGTQSGVYPDQNPQTQGPSPSHAGAHSQFGRALGPVSFSNGPSPFASAPKKE